MGSGHVVLAVYPIKLGQCGLITMGANFFNIYVNNVLSTPHVVVYALGGNQFTFPPVPPFPNLYGLAMMPRP